MSKMLPLAPLNSPARRRIGSLARCSRLARRLRRWKRTSNKTSKDQREKDSEVFAKRVALLIDSMHSAAIDVGKIMADEIDDKAWNSYLKGNRGVFTSRAVRLLGGSEHAPSRPTTKATSNSNAR